MLLDGLALRNFRSFGDEFQFMAGLRKVNLLAGANNSGKSNILEFIIRHFGRGGSRTPPAGFDIPQVPGSRPDGLELAIAIPDDDQRIKQLYEAVSGARRSTNPNAEVDALLQTKAFRLTGDRFLWFRFSPAGGDLQPSNQQALDAATECGRELGPISSALTNTAGGPAGSDAIRIIQWLKISERFPMVETISAFRQIRGNNSPTADPTYDGENLITQLQKLQNPPPGPERQTARKQFAAINKFVKAVLEDDSAGIEVPHDLSTLTIQQREIELPLEHFGTGIHHVIILAAAATVLSNKVVCIEEPEIHLHPLLQRKLVRYLSDAATSNQYIIATHSAPMLDHERASVYRISSSPSGSTVSPARRPAELAAICAELGYRPSDILQSNAVIWVEGPSDRIYLRTWINQLDPDLIEGIHYSIMFYGGRLLNHLTMNDPEIDDFISLRRLNRNLAVVIDSDKTSPHKHINNTKKRVRDEFNTGESLGFAWITDGYTIENYLPSEVLSDVVTELYPSRRYEHPGSKWANPLLGEGGFKYDKIKIANEISVRLQVDRMTPGLRVEIARVVSLIHAANNII